MARFVELTSSIGETIFINPDQVIQLSDKGVITHVHFAANSSGDVFTPIHLPIGEVAKLLSEN